MDSSLDNIWDEPLVEGSPKRSDPPLDLDEDNDSVRRPAKRPRQTLFLADSDDDIQASPQKAVQKAPPVQDVDIDALFADLDEDDDALVFKPLPPRINEAELTRQAEERARKSAPSLTPHQIMPSSSPQRDTDNPSGSGRTGGKKGENEKDDKPRRKFVKLDENRLLSTTDGFPRLIKMTKDFRIKGKGHEATDLNRLLQQYQYWTHSLYPKTQFRETVERIEKLCHSKRMNVSLSVWRDDAHGKPRQKESSDEDDIVQSEDENQGNKSSGLPRSSPSRRSSPSAVSESDIPNHPQPPPPKAPQGSYREEDDEEDFWKSLDDITGDISDPPPPAPTTAPNSSMDEDEDMWDIVNEIEQAAVGTASTISNPATVEPPTNPIPPGDDDWEDMYV